jgi:PIN domain nuclease of toxin-antitoxin system
MRILLDACSFLWIALEPERLPEQAMEAFRNPESSVFLSSVTVWEVSVKFHIGKLALPAAPHVFIPAERKEHAISPLKLSEKDTFRLASLPPLHKDPFDRMLVCQAIENGLAILAADQHVRQHPVQTPW